jgi:short-subunit dehydrogenase
MKVLKELEKRSDEKYIKKRNQGYIINIVSLSGK